MRKYYIYISFAVVLILVYILLITLAPRHINWDPTFQNKHKYPFGTRALYEMMNRMPAYSPMQNVHQPIYNQLSQYPLYASYSYNVDSVAAVLKADSLVAASQKKDSLPGLTDKSNNSPTADSMAAAEKADSIAATLRAPDSPSPTEAHTNHTYTSISDSLKRNYIFINKDFLLNETDLEYLLNDVSKGDNVFIAAYTFSQKFADTLHLHPKVFWNINKSLNYTVEDKNYTVNKISLLNYGVYLDSMDTLTTEVLGYRDSTYPVFVRVKYGAGNFYINLAPEMFTNLYVLNDTTYTYSFYCLGYLDGKTTWWDEYYKVGREESDSLLRYVMSQPPLKTAWYVLLFTAFMFALFESKRRQKSIPIVKALRNDSLEFIKSLSAFYFKNSRHSIMAEKKWNFLNDYLRAKYNFSADITDADLADKLARKTSYPKENATALITLTQNILNAPEISEKALIEFNHSINQFYKYTK